MSTSAEYDKFLRKIASNIKKARKNARLTQMDMVNHRFNYRHYQRLESGLAGYNMMTLFKLAKVFKTTIIDLLSK